MRLLLCVFTFACLLETPGGRQVPAFPPSCIVATGIDIIADAEAESPIAWQGLLKRILHLEALHRRFWIQNYVENVRKLSLGQSLGTMDEWEAAKRLGIGTFLGKHNQVRTCGVWMFARVRGDGSVHVCCPCAGGCAQSQ